MKPGTPIPHKPECFVYRHALGLMGKDRRGLCDCGAEESGGIMKRYTHQTIPISRVWIEGPDGEPVEIPREHPDHQRFNELAARHLVASLMEKEDNRRK